VNPPNWNLEGDGETVTVTFPTSPIIKLKLGVKEIEELLRHLGNFRRLMKPEVPSLFAPGQKVMAVPDPAWATEVDAMVGSTLLHVRDPRYGWLHYVIPRDEARKLAGFLQTHADSLPPLRPQEKLN